MRKFIFLIVICVSALFFSVSLIAAEITSTTTGGNWSSTSTWIYGIVPTSADNVIIDGPVYVDINSGYQVSCINLTVNSGSNFTIGDTCSPSPHNYPLILTVTGNFTVGANAVVRVGGTIGGRLTLAGQNRIHQINGIIHVNWSIQFNTINSQSIPSVMNVGTTDVDDGAAIILEAPPNNGVLMLYGDVKVIVNNKAKIENYCQASSKGFEGIYMATASNQDPIMQIDGTLKNGTNGTILIAQGLLTVNGIFYYSSGIWNRNSQSVAYGPNGVLVYNGGAISTSKYEWPTTSSPPNVTINSTGNITMNGARTITGTLSLQQSQLVNSTFLTMGDGATINRSGGTISAAPTFTNNCNIIYSNTSDITSGPELPPATGTVLNNLTMLSSSDKTVTLSANAIVKGTLALTLGNIATGTNTLTLGTGTGNIGILSLSSNPEDKTGIISGNFKRWFSTSSTALTKFPVGDVAIGFGNGFYPKKQLELTFSSISTGGSITVKYVNGDAHSYNTTPPEDPTGYFIDSYSKIGSWEVTPADGLAFSTYSLNIYPTGIAGANNPEQLRVMKRPSGTTTPWVLEGTHSTGSGLPSLRASRTGLTSFSTFAIGGNAIAGNPLDGPNPVELSSFTANVISRDVKLNWTTATELNNAGFEIQKSEVRNQNSEWTKVGYVTGNGTKTTPTNYSFEDKKLNTGKYNYRLKQIDYNGNFEYFNLSNTIEIGVPKKFNLSQNYPNPFNPATKIDFDLPYDSKVSIKFYDISGREVMTLLNEQKTAGYYTVQMNGNNLSSGIYFYRFTVEGSGQNYMMIKKAVLIK